MRQQRTGDWGVSSNGVPNLKGYTNYLTAASPLVLPHLVSFWPHVPWQRQLTFEQGQWSELLLVALIAELRRAV